MNFFKKFKNKTKSFAKSIAFDIYTWNEDTIHAHGVTIRIGMVSNELFMARFLPSYGYKQLAKIIKEEEIKQVDDREPTIQQPFSWLPAAEQEKEIEV